MRNVYLALVAMLLIASGCQTSDVAKSGTHQAPSVEIGTQPIYISPEIAFSDGNTITDAVKNECQLTTLLPDYILEYAQSYNVPVAVDEAAFKADKGLILKLEITAADSGWSAWSGHQKYTQVKGQLYENGMVKASFIAGRNSKGGFAGNYKNTCSVLRRSLKAVAKDIANWLKAPKDGAVLGNG
ncbi:MAG: hypothetical protein EOM20_01195 [Spartobacteria bacterium]|nr:hypothetical protein [Spartobacteria bacterium]